MNTNKLILNQHKSSSYAPRTWHNASSGDVTVAFAVDLNTAGERLTHKAAGEKYIGFKLEDSTDAIDLAKLLYKKMKKDNAKTLNIAGNGIYTLSKHNCSQDFINHFVYEVINQVHQYHPIEKIFTGGQTGVDMAGAIAGIQLGIPVEITFPHGYMQRFEDKKDIIQTEQDILEQIRIRLENLNINLEKEVQKTSIIKKPGM